MDDFVPRVGLPVGGSAATRGNSSPTLPRESAKGKSTDGSSSPAVELDLSDRGAIGAALGEAAKASKIQGDLERGAAAAKATAEFLQQSMEEIKNSLRALGLLPEEAEGIGLGIGRRLKAELENAYTPPQGLLATREISFSVEYIAVNLSLQGREVSLSLTHVSAQVSESLTLFYGTGGGSVATEGNQDRLVDVAV